jgi:hypothetical protein
MIGKKSLSIVVVASFLAVAFMASTGNVNASPSDWKEGQVWGYKWQVNLADLKSDIEDAIRNQGGNVESLDLNGGASAFFYVKYLGNTSEGYKFAFKGGSYAEMHVYEKAKGEEGNNEGTVKMDAKYSTDYSGTFWLIRDSAGYYSETSYYGVSKIYCNVSADIDMNMNGQYTENGESHSVSSNEKGNVEFKNLKLEFSPSIPMLPLDTTSQNNQISTMVSVDYSGERSGHLSMTSTYPSMDGTDKTDSVDQDLDKHIYGSSSLYAQNYTMPIDGIANIAYLSTYGNKFNDINIHSLVPTNMHMKYGNGFISSISEDISLGPVNSNPIESQPATEEEVNEYLQDKKGHTPGVSSGLNLLLIGAIIGIIAVVAIAAVVLMKRRKPPAMTGYQQQPQEVMEQPYPQNQEYQQMPAPEPAQDMSQQLPEPNVPAPQDDSAEPPTF